MAGLFGNITNSAPNWVGLGLGLSLAIMLCYSIDDHEFCFVGQHIFVALRTQNFFVTSIKFD